MKHHIAWIMAALLASLISAPTVSLADVPSASTVKPEGTMPVSTPSTGDEVMSKLASEKLRGKLLKTDGKIFTIETSPGQQVSLRANKDTHMMGKHTVGERIRADYTPDGRALSVTSVEVPRGSAGG